jgi:hypothetical protein
VGRPGLSLVVDRRTMTNLADTSPAPVAVEAAARDKRFLFGPVTDFLCLGGSSLFLLPLLFVLPAADYRAPIATAMLLIAHLVNHPHFAHSYQIFYRGFRAKAFRPDLGRAMQARYFFAGLIAPAILFAFCAISIARGDARLLGYGGNIMALFVGWHYVKQGYGMLMVDAVLKRKFFKDPEKKVFLANSYLVWIFAWLSVNDIVSQHQLWGLQYYSFAIPAPIVLAAGLAALASGLLTLWILFSRWRESGGLPINGVLAYFVSLYLWLLFVWINPLWLLVVPALHSLQYLVVVWRYELNYERGREGALEPLAVPLVERVFGSRYYASMTLFAATGLVIGYLGFWGVPRFLDSIVPYDKEVFGGTMFLFVFWIFINVHHYFLDNVMWRRENPDTRRYLFS